MDYFKILNLRTEPFSNSPDPEFFYRSEQHLSCLQKLELAIRLKRGLNVVIGDVGTGKTTLSRQLFLQHEKDENLEIYLLLDPSFSTTIEFLIYISNLFKLGTADSEWQYKENIKNYLFQKGVDYKKTVVLIIDEGQKLPDFCLEILREFMNYETNDFKLIQIVIFAQDEFRTTLENHANFADRININISLGSLNFSETKALINFRLKMASQEGRLPGIFSYPAYWTIFRLTQGKPRRIVQLCHNLLLALIIQNKSRITSSMVKSCFNIREPRKFWLPKWGTFLLIICVLMAIVLFVYPDWRARNIDINLPNKSSEQAKTFVSGINVQSVLDKSLKDQNGPEAQKSAVEPIQNNLEMKELGRINISQGETVFQLLTDIYGVISEKIFRAVVLSNPHIKNLNHVRAGDDIKFPFVELKPAKESLNFYYIKLSDFDNLASAYSEYKKYRRDRIPVRIVSYGDGTRNIKYEVLLKSGFRMRESAIKTAKEFNGDIISLDKNKTYYSDLG